MCATLVPIRCTAFHPSPVDLFLDIVTNGEQRLRDGGQRRRRIESVEARVPSTSRYVQTPCPLLKVLNID